MKTLVKIISFVLRHTEVCVMLYVAGLALASLTKERHMLNWGVFGISIILAMLGGIAGIITDHEGKKDG